MPETKSFVDHNQAQQRREDYWDRTEDIRETIRKCARALERGQRKHYHYVARKTADTLVPRLLDDDTLPEDYDDVLTGHPDWTFDALSEFMQSPQRYVAATVPDVPNQYSGLTASTTFTPGVDAGETAARVCIHGAFRSLAAIAEEEEIIRAELRTRVDAVGFAAKVGEHLQDAEMDIGDPVRLVSEQSGALKSLFTGGTGQGKSAALEAEAEDYYLRNFKNDGEAFKLIDLVGLRDGENWFYDIPQHDDDLRRIREDMGLPGGFDDAEDDIDRQLEILVPLTPGLEQQNVPFNTETGGFVIRPFTVPASEIRKPLLVSMIITKLTPQQESIVRTAYDDVNRRKTDWTLADLAEEIRTRDELSDDKKKPAIATLRQLQEGGFIRTKEDDHTIDWREIFEDAETITVFSQAFMDDVIGKLVAFGYLTDTIVQKRERMHGVPSCVLLMRELWKVAPHNRRQEFDNRAAALQEAIGQMLAKLFRENRHSGVHLLADTQQPSDLLKPVREMFNRYVVFNTNKDTTKDIFEWTANDKWVSFYNTLSPKAGEASVVGMVEPAIEERDIEFLGPIQYATASHHHRMEEIDTTGWHARCKYVDAEELRRPADIDGIKWGSEVPTRLKVDVGYDEDKAPDVERQPVKVFADRCLAQRPGSAVKRKGVRSAFNEFLAAHDLGRRDLEQQREAQKFGERLKKALGSDSLGRTTRDGERAYPDLEFTKAGEEYLEKAMEGFEDAATPIQGD